MTRLPRLVTRVQRPADVAPPHDPLSPQPCAVPRAHPCDYIAGEMAAIMAGGVAAGIYPTDTPDQVEYKSKHSSASIAVVENEAKIAVFARICLDFLG